MPLTSLILVALTMVDDIYPKQQGNETTANKTSSSSLPYRIELILPFLQFFSTLFQNNNHVVPTYSRVVKLWMFLGGVLQGKEKGQQSLNNLRYNNSSQNKYKVIKECY